MPASCVTRWWTSLPVLQFIINEQEALSDVLYKLKSNSIKYLPSCIEQKLIRVIYDNGDTEELFSTTSQCALSTGEITSYFNSNEVDETSNSDEDTSANTNNDTSSDTMLNHFEEQYKKSH
ncbi:hypothetical protein QTP88_016770 [Uroleucon formosanum]